MVDGERFNLHQHEKDLIMSMSCASCTSGPSQSNSMGGYGHARRDAREKLVKSLEAGDLDGAKAAYQRLKELSGGRMFRQFRDDPGATTTLRNDFSAIGTALEAGDIENAKAAYGVLQGHLQMARDARDARNAGEVNADVMPQPGMSISMTITYVSLSFSYASSAAPTTGTQLNVAG